jgi:hypothetical protein
MAIPTENLRQIKFVAPFQPIASYIFDLKNGEHAGLDKSGNGNHLSNTEYYTGSYVFGETTALHAKSNLTTTSASLTQLTGAFTINITVMVSGVRAVGRKDLVNIGSNASIFITGSQEHGTPTLTTGYNYFICFTDALGTHFTRSAPLSWADWTNITVTRGTTSSVSIYLNGGHVGTFTRGGTTPVTGGNFMLTGSGMGLVRNLTVWNRELEPNEIKHVSFKLLGH